MAAEDESIDEPAEAEAGPSILPPPAPAPAPRSILTFFGNGATASGSTLPPTTVTAPRKRRKKAEDDPGQARFLAPGEGQGWALGRRVEEDKPEKAGRKPKRADIGEEAEAKEMNKRLKAAEKLTEAAAAAREGIGEDGQGDDAFGIAQSLAGGDLNAKSSNGQKPSPGKRKRGRPRKVDSSTVPSQSRTGSQSSTVRSKASLPGSPPVITLLSSDPVDPEQDERPIITGIKLDRSASSHPFFSRANSSTAAKGGSQHDAIDIDEPIIKVAGPKKLIFAADQKASHGFFGRSLKVDGLASQTMSRVSSTGAEGGRKRSKSPEKLQPKGKPSGFFQLAAQPQLGQLKDGWGGVKPGEEWLAPMPGQVWPTHIGCSKYTPPYPSIAVKRRRAVSPVDIGPLDMYFAGEMYQSPQQPAGVVRPTAPIPPIDHPAVRSVPLRSRKSNRETWCERYRPLRASHVLGNETEAAYLRDWLRVLSVGSDGSSAKVARRVPRRKAHLTDGWIIDDIGLFDEELDEVEEDFEAIEELPTFGKRATSYPPFDSRLSNAMLITGPHGSGKSAAVYAAAQELGWEVFEVYAGIGKRTGANLFSLVGEVGKNHIVITGKSPKKPKAKQQMGTKTFFGGSNGDAQAKNGHSTKNRANYLPIPSSSQGSQGDPIQLDDTGWDGTFGLNGSASREGSDEVEVLENGHQGFRQSVILLDEVDLLFEEESTFWPAVIALIAESRRPVILTCNDPQRVPIASLPLQSILRFEPPPAEVAVPYLDAIAKHERLSHVDARELYHASFSSPPDVLDQPQPLPPNGHEPLAYFDLRRAITQMQLDRDRAQRTVASSAETNDLQRVAQALEQRSFADAWVAPRSWAVMNMCEIDRHSASIDDLLGVHALEKPHPSSDRPVLASYSRESEIAKDLLGLTSSIPPLTADNLGETQTHYVRSLLPLLDPLIPLSANLLPHASLFTAYLPVLRSIVDADDLMQIAEEEALARGEDRVNRKTGRAIRITSGAGAGWASSQGYMRYLKVGEAGEDVVRRYRLGEGRQETP